MSGAPKSYTVILRHLSPDVREAGFDFGEVEVKDVSAAQLKKMLESLARLAPKAPYPSLPEMRISGGEEQFLVVVREGHVRFSSWRVRGGGYDLTPGQIFAAIAGEEEEPVEEPERKPETVAMRSPRNRNRWIVLLALGILGANSLTAWMLTRAPGSLPPEILPAYRFLEPEPGQRLLARVAGTYETGQAEGDRRLFLRRDGTVVWNRYGAGRTMVEETLLNAVGAETGGQPALMVNNTALIQVKDATTLVYFGDTYHRVQP